jgi:hypothetical protein
MEPEDPLPCSQERGLVPIRSQTNIVHAFILYVMVILIFSSHLRLCLYFLRGFSSKMLYLWGTKWQETYRKEKHACESLILGGIFLIKKSAFVCLLFYNHITFSKIMKCYQCSACKARTNSWDLITGVAHNRAYNLDKQSRQCSSQWDPGKHILFCSHILLEICTITFSKLCRKIYSDI